MTDGKSVQDFLNRLVTYLLGLGKSCDNVVRRPKAVASVQDDTIPPVSDKMKTEKLARVSNNRVTTALTEKKGPHTDQWQKLKESAKASDPAESNIDHWNQKQGGILSGATFDAATADISNGARPRKRPSVVSQARITSNRLQALQAQIDKSANQFDQAEEAET